MRTVLGETVRSTTVVALRRNGVTVMAGDGQVSLGDTVLKGTARKVRTLLDGKVLVGFAGSAADGLALFERLEGKLRQFGGNLTRAAVELAKDWRTDKILRRLDAVILVADKEKLFFISGTGDVLEPDEGIAAIGSGGSYALAAARALTRHTDMGAREVATEALKLASEICIYTNDRIVVEQISAEDGLADGGAGEGNEATKEQKK
ncbi:MAG: ATP-dependent protease subunit HslV [Deltaproteobacteria bacterium]|nr:ATP-dependent protease subunit HslV [Deltaproteobacteria bacterium]